MSLPLPPNTTLDIYRALVVPPASPAIAGVRGHLRGDWRSALHAINASWTHVLLVDANVDLRDGYVGGFLFIDQDSVYIPDQNGTRFKVVFIERVDPGTANEHKRAYLDRQTPSWPSDNL